MNSDLELITNVPRVDKKEGVQNLTIRLSGSWLRHWKKAKAANPRVSSTNLLKEFMSLGFHATALDDSGEPVEVVLRSKGQDGRQLPDRDLLELAGVPTLLRLRENRRQKK